MRDFMDFVMEVILPVAILAIVAIVMLFSLIAITDYVDCAGFQNGTGIETRWSWGCYAKVNGEWVPKDYVFGKAHELRFKDKTE